MRNEPKAVCRDNGAAHLAGMIGAVRGACVYCNCTGESCKTVTGEQCELVGMLAARCNGVACEHRYYADQLAEKRRRTGRRRR